VVQILKTIKKLNEDLDKIFKYLCMNNLAVNVKKCQCLVIQNKNSVIDEDSINIKINNVKIAVVDQVKYLGIIIENRLNFQVHKKMSVKAHFLKRMSTNMSQYTKLLLYKSILAPHVENCSTLLFMPPNYGIKELQLIQNRCMRITLNCSKYTHIEDMLFNKCKS
jgi:hypothetical protein